MRTGVHPRIRSEGMLRSKTLYCIWRRDLFAEDFFRGHFPGHPIMPGVLQLEAMAQVAGILLLKRIEAANQIAYFMSAEEVKWRKPVVPGDVLVIEVELTKIRGKIGKARGVCKVDGEVVSEAAVTFMLRDA